MKKRKKNRIENRTMLVLCQSSSYNALFPAQYTPISVVIDGSHDNDAMLVSVLRDSMMLDRYTL